MYVKQVSMCVFVCREGGGGMYVKQVSMCVLA